MILTAARCVGLLSLILVSPFAFGDKVTMKNGDRLTGKLIKSDDKTVTFESELAGKVTISLESILAVTSDEPITLELQDGQLLFGQLQAEGDTFTVSTPDAGEVHTTREKVLALRSAPEQELYLEEQERLSNPRFMDHWAGSFDAGYAATRGNASTNTVNVAANAFRKTARDKLSLSFTSIRTNARVQNDVLTTANAVRGNLRHDRNFSDRGFAFGLTDLEFDRFQRLDLRFVLGAGGGFHAWRREKSSFDLIAGANMNKEFFATGLQRTAAEGLFGEELNHNFGSALVLKEKLIVYPNFTNTGEYRINFDVSLFTSINRWLGWNLGISTRYLSNPLPGAMNSDLLFTTGIRLSFTGRSAK